MFKLFAAVAATAILGTASQSFAGPPVETMSVPVRIADLDLGHADGARIALHRIANAANEICGGEPANQDIQGRQAYVGCMKTTVHDSVARLDSPEVARLELGAPAGVTLVANR
ncbi:MAG TPA: UrcA family protein [Caulobacteraceae bacterium]|jgi:UrcA family protein